MAFRFRRKESVKRAIQRLGAGCNEEILRCLHCPNRAKAIHGARKGIKKARALLRLIRSELSKSSYARQSGPFRRAARKLSAVRDAYVAANLLEELHRDADGNLPREFWQRGQSLLGRDLEATLRSFDRGESVPGIERILNKPAKRWRSFALKEKGWRVLGPGIQKTYKAARRAHQTAENDPTPGNLHEWRKRSKDLWHVLLLLEPVRPDKIRTVARRLKKLTDHLGDDHDLLTLERKCFADGESENSTGREQAQRLLQRRHRKLRQSAFKLGADLFAESPKTFCHDLETDWRRWRNE